jgi:hypothetical protein
MLVLQKSIPPRQMKKAALTAKFNGKTGEFNKDKESVRARRPGVGDGKGEPEKTS